MSYTLRDYQKEAVSTALNRFENYRSPFILSLSVAAGKSLIIADICHKLDEPVLILQPSRELILQNYEKLKSYGVDDISMYSASVNSKEIAKYTYATIQSVYKKPELFKHFKYVLCDECDLLNMEQKSSMYHKFFKGLGDIKVCGLTATPYRAKRYATIDKIGNMSYVTEFKLLNRFWPMFFKEIAYSKDIGELQEEGYVSRAEYFTLEDDDWDLLKINSTGADFTEESLEHFADRKVRQMMEILPTLINHKKVLFFCSSIRQATMVSNALSSAKITCPLITANTPKKERAQIVEDYKSGKIRFLANVSTLLAGFDVPDIDAIVMMRPTLSIRVLYQSLGRGLRLDPNDPNKVLSVYDLAGVTLRFGRVETLKIGYEDPEAVMHGRFSPNILLSEVGRLDNVVLSSFRIKNEKMKNRLRGIAKRI